MQLNVLLLHKRYRLRVIVLSYFYLFIYTQGHTLGFWMLCCNQFIFCLSITVPQLAKGELIILTDLIQKALQRSFWKHWRCCQSAVPCNIFSNQPDTNLISIPRITTPLKLKGNLREYSPLNSNKIEVSMG